jgi:hypothetical protein
MIWRRQIFKWLPPWDPLEHMWMKRTINRTDIGLLWRLLGVPVGSEIKITAFCNDAQLTCKEWEELVKELDEIAETLCGAGGLDRTVGDVLKPAV